MLDLAAADRHAVPDGSEGPDVRVFDDGSSADDGRASHDASHDTGLRLDHDPAGDLGVLDHAVDARVQRVQHDAVRLEEVLELPRVLPPALDDVGMDRQPAVDEVLNGVGDL